MVLNNGVVRGSHGHRRAEFPWMYVQGWHMVPMDGVRETHGWCIDEVKKPIRQGRVSRTCSWPIERYWSPQRGRNSHVRGRLLGYTCEWSPTLNKGLRPFGLKCVSICYINYSRKLPKMFISLTYTTKLYNRVLQQWRYRYIFYLPCYSAQLYMAVHCSWELKNKNKNFLFSIWLKYYLFVDFFFLFFLSIVTRSQLPLNSPTRVSTPSELSPLCLIAAGLNVTDQPLTHSVEVLSCRSTPPTHVSTQSSISPRTQCRQAWVSLDFMGFIVNPSSGFLWILWVSLGFIVVGWLFLAGNGCGLYHWSVCCFFLW